MGLFDRIEGAESSKGGRYFSPGKYTLMINKCISKESQQSHGTITIIETVVMKVHEAYDRVMEPDGTTVAFSASNEEGETVAIFNKKSSNMFLGNIKGFIAGACNVAESEVTSTACDNVFAGDGTALAGTMIELEAIPIRLANGKPFTKLLFSPHDAELYRLLLEKEAAEKAAA